MRKLTLRRPTYRGLGFTGEQKSAIAKWTIIGMGAGSAFLGYRGISDPTTPGIERIVAAVVGVTGAAVAAAVLLDIKKLF